MRITVHLDTFDTAPRAYAILWLDDKSLRWSREAHAGIALPAWGTLRTELGNTLILGSSGAQALCVLEGLELERHGFPFEGEVGRVHCYAPDLANPESGHWHVQCLDSENITPEFGIFADDQSA